MLNMIKKHWVYLLVIPVASFGVYYLVDLLMNFQSDIGGLLIMGMLIFGWPGISAWLGTVAGKNLREGWYLPFLFAWCTRFVFPYYGAGWIAWAYAGGVLLIGLITMVCTKLVQ